MKKKIYSDDEFLDLVLDLPKTGSLARTSKYWICGECAKNNKWIWPKWPVTAIAGLCGHCDRLDEVTLIPTCDFGGKNKKPVWD